MLNYVVDGMGADNEILFVQKADQYLTETLKGEVMTLSERFKQIGREEGLQQGMQKGVEKERQEIALHLLKEGWSRFNCQSH